MSLQDTLQEFYYDMSLNELKLARTTAFPNISYNSLLYIDLIYYSGKCTVTYLADKLQITKSAVTLKVNELVKQGLIAREQNSGDRRMNYLSLTDAAREEWQIYDRGLKVAVDKLQQKYGEKDIEVFRKMLDTLCEEYKKVVYDE